MSYSMFKVILPGQWFRRKNTKLFLFVKQVGKKIPQTHIKGPQGSRKHRKMGLCFGYPTNLPCHSVLVP